MMRLLLSSAAGVALTSVMGAHGVARAQQPLLWQGFYAGAFAGGAWGSSTTTTRSICVGSEYYCSPGAGFANAVAVDASGSG